MDANQPWSCFELWYCFVNIPVIVHLVIPSSEYYCAPFPSRFSTRQFMLSFYRLCNLTPFSQPFRSPTQGLSYLRFPLVWWSTMTKSYLGVGVELHLILSGCTIQHWEVRAGTEAAVMEEHSLLACSASFFYMSQDHPKMTLPKVGRALK